MQVLVRSLIKIYNNISHYNILQFSFFQFYQSGFGISFDGSSVVVVVALLLLLLCTG
jgi:hypothetical protein